MGAGAGAGAGGDAPAPAAVRDIIMAENTTGIAASLLGDAALLAPGVGHAVVSSDIGARPEPNAESSAVARPRAVSGFELGVGEIGRTPRIATRTVICVWSSRCVESGCVTGCVLLSFASCVVCGVDPLAVVLALNWLVTHELALVVTKFVSFVGCKTIACVVDPGAFGSSLGTVFGGMVLCTYSTCVPAELTSRIQLVRAFSNPVRSAGLGWAGLGWAGLGWVDG